MMKSENYKKGLDVLNGINPQAIGIVEKMLKDICPDMADFIVEFPYGQIWTRDGLDIKTRELITIASLTTLGYARDQLKSHIINALNAGCTKKEIVEVILQMCIYAGFPAAISALLEIGRASCRERG